MKLAIFDMDGTLFNTNNINYFAYKEALSKYDIDLNYDYFCKFCNGRHYKVFIPALVDLDDEKTEDVHQLKKQAYKKYIDKVVVNEHLFNIINCLKPEYKIALVTTASKKNTMEILEFTKTKTLFDLILTQEEISNPKPDPEGFVTAMKTFESSPSETLIFEDSAVGIEAALKTNATVFKVEKF